VPESIYLFGAGGAASWAIQGFKRENIKISGFLDDNAKSIVSINKIPVYEPDSSEISNEEKRNSKVIFTVMNPNVDILKIKKYLEKFNWLDFKSFEDFVKEEHQITGKRLSMLDPSVFEKNKSELAKTRSLFFDNHSKILFDSFVNFCCQDKDYDFPEITPNPYFPPDLPEWPKNLRFVDCGAYSGDTVQSALNNKYKINSCFCFEPDPKNFEMLVDTLKDIDNSYAWPCGVFNSSKVLKFASGGDTGSALSSDGDITIQCVALDEVIRHSKPNLIKFDIEGAEQSALRGAENILKEYRPHLAVSVYHLSTDIWKIPLYLSNIYGEKTKFYLRRHSRTVADTVLYVYPE